MAQISVLPGPPVALRLERNAIRLPSGDQAGLRSDAPAFLVRRWMCVPSARMV